MEASALTHASRSGLLVRRSPLLRLQRDERLVELIRERHDRAFEVLFDRYHARLLAFCRGILGSAEDGEDVLQDVFVNAHIAMLADSRALNLRPWLYRIARNRCLNHLRRPAPEGTDSIEAHPAANGASTLERVQRREELRAIFSDVAELPETQRTALVLREIDDLSYEEIAQAMGTTLGAVKSLLVRARMALAEASEGRVLDCGEVRLHLAEAAEGLRTINGATRYHIRKSFDRRPGRSPRSRRWRRSGPRGRGSSRSSSADRARAARQERAGPEGGPPPEPGQGRAPAARAASASAARARRAPGSGAAQAPRASGSAARGRRRGRARRPPQPPARPSAAAGWPRAGSAAGSAGWGVPAASSAPQGPRPQPGLRPPRSSPPERSASSTR